MFHLGPRRSITPRFHKRFVCLLIVTLVNCFATDVAKAGDWPQILGPNRNGSGAADEQLSERWTAQGPPLLWSKKVGNSYAGIVVENELAILFHRVSNREVVECLNASTGETLWTSDYETSFRPQVGGGNGPLATPAIADGRVVTFGAEGILACHDLKSGKKVWSIKTHEVFGARSGYFGAGSSPLIDEGRVIVNVGGFQSGASVVAFSLKDGAVLWKTLDDHASYSSPIVGEVHGKKRVIIITRLNFLLLDPATGAISTQFRFGQVGPTVNGAVPTILGNRLFVTSSYGIGAMLVTAGENDVRESYRSDELYSSQYCTPVLHAGMLFGVDGRDDLPPAELKCFDPINRKILWTAPESAYGTVILADGKLLILSTDGQLTLARAVVNKYDPIATARVLNGTARALPALSNGRLFVRDETTLKCLNVGIPKPKP